MKVSFLFLFSVFWDYFGPLCHLLRDCPCSFKKLSGKILLHARAPHFSHEHSFHSAQLSKNMSHSHSLPSLGLMPAQIAPRTLKQWGARTERKSEQKKILFIA
jgi:hypothetical protein